MNDHEQWRELAQQLRVDSIRCSDAAQSGHPTSSLSAADLMTVLISNHLHCDYSEPDNPNNDHLIFSKGHASPLLYSMYKALGLVTDEELLTYRSTGSRLEGHPTPTCRGSRWPPVRWAKVCRWASAWPWPRSGWTICRTGHGCCAATAR
jgi:Transketolase